MKRPEGRAPLQHLAITERLRIPEPPQSADVEAASRPRSFGKALNRYRRSATSSTIVQNQYLRSAMSRAAGKPPLRGLQPRHSILQRWIVSVSALTFQYERGGIHLPKLAFWLDPHEPQAGPEKVFISHAHSDHIGEHREVILSAPTAHFLRARIGGAREEHILPFGQPTAFDSGGAPWRITLLPAGHVFGSAMSWIEAEGESLLYTGDFKLRRGLSAEPCEPRRADTLILETTYGQPKYQFPPTAEVLQGVIRFCREAIDTDETAVLLGYSLGKSQELLRGLADADLPITLHESVFKLAQIYERLGQTFPRYTRFEGRPSAFEPKAMPLTPIGGEG